MHHEPEFRILAVRYLVARYFTQCVGNVLSETQWNPSNIQRLSLGAGGDKRTYTDLATPAGLAWISRYADGVGLNKNLIVPRDSAGRLLAPTSVIRDAHRQKLVVHAWTFRAENQFLPVDFRIGTDPNARGDITSEYELFFDLGLDGVFSDHPDTAVAARAGR